MTSMTNVSCPHCGELNSSSALACVTCRHSLPVQELAATPTDAISPTVIQLQNQEIESPNRQLKITLLNVTIAGLLLVTPIVFLWKATHSATKPEPSRPVSTSLVISETIPDVVSAPHPTGRQPKSSVSQPTQSLDEQFFRAIAAGDLSRAQQLFRQGASINSYIPSGVPALVTAARLGNTETIQWMLDNGADVNVRILATAKSERAVGWTPLMMASAKGQVAAVELLLKNKARIDLKSQDNIGPLHCAAVSGNGQVARLLIDYGADPNEPGLGGLRPIISAADAGNTEVVRILLEKGVDPNSKGVAGESALSHAIAKNHHDTARVLRDAGAR